MRNIFSKSHLTFKAAKFKLVASLVASAFLTSCSDFPDYRYEQAQDSCMLSFPFAAGIIGRKYIGYFNLISTLQYLDSEPELSIFIGEPSHIEIEVGSVQKIEINDQVFVPQFHQNYLQGEYQYWGPAFTFNHEQSSLIYAALKEGYDMTIYGRVEIGEQYETEMYNLFFDDTDEPFRACINRLLTKEEVSQLGTK
jgi:hypothetical protein